MRMLNLGCGSNFHKDWINIDIVSNNENVIEHNLLNGIPFEDNEFDAVYHSHVLEHFSKEMGIEFIKECYRVLKPNGIIRVVVPDLESIIDEYKKNLQLALSDDYFGKLNYEWIMLELFDQTTRHKSQGKMGEYLRKEKLENESYILSRIGKEALGIRELSVLSDNKDDFNKKALKKIKSVLHPSRLKELILQLLLGSEEYENWKIGQFRKGGEVHQWMYDRYSLKVLLEGVGFANTQVKTAFTGEIHDWEKYQLDGQKDVVYKPDSLFMEAVKCKYCTYLHILMEGLLKLP